MVGKFKGNSLISQDEVIDIQAILEQERASTISGGVFKDDVDLLKYIRDPSAIISEKELKEMMDRSQAAFDRFEKERGSKAL